MLVYSSFSTFLNEQMFKERLRQDQNLVAHKFEGSHAVY